MLVLALGKVEFGSYHINNQEKCEMSLHIFNQPFPMQKVACILNVGLGRYR